MVFYQHKRRLLHIALCFALILETQASGISFFSSSSKNRPYMEASKVQEWELYWSAIKSSNILKKHFIPWENPVNLTEMEYRKFLENSTNLTQFKQKGDNLLKKITQNKNPKTEIKLISTFMDFLEPIYKNDTAFAEYKESLSSYLINDGSFDNITQKHKAWMKKFHKSCNKRVQELSEYAVSNNSASSQANFQKNLNLFIQREVLSNGFNKDELDQITNSNYKKQAKRIAKNLNNPLDNSENCRIGNTPSLENTRDIQELLINRENRAKPLPKGATRADIMPPPEERLESSLKVPENSPKPAQISLWSSLFGQPKNKTPIENFMESPASLACQVIQTKLNELDALKNSRNSNKTKEEKIYEELAKQVIDRLQEEDFPSQPSAQRTGKKHVSFASTTQRESPANRNTTLAPHRPQTTTKTINKMKYVTQGVSQKDKKTAEANRWLTPGSAVIGGSGSLNNGPNSIQAIVHAAPGSMEGAKTIEPTLESVLESVKNSVKLAIEEGHKRIAIPLVGGGIFLDRINAKRSPQKKITIEELAKEIIKVAAPYGDQIQLVFMDYASSKHFQNANKQLKTRIITKNGDITDFKKHQCTAIVNAANVELIFGGGISGNIKDAINAAANKAENPINADQVQKETQEVLQKHYSTKKP